MDLIVTTSPIRQTHYIDRAIESVSHIEFNKKFILFDGLPEGADEDVIQRYDHYKLRLAKDYPEYEHVYGKSHRWFIGGMDDIINNYSDSPWCFCIQHDVVLCDKFDPYTLLNDRPKDANILCFPHKQLTKETHWFKGIIEYDSNWYKTYGWTERVFMFDRSNMISLLKQYTHRKFIEYIMYNQMNSSYAKQNMEAIWNIWKCYSHRYYLHKHLVGKTDKVSPK